MLYLHGGGARGRDNVAQVAQTPDFMLDEAKRRNAFLYVPQMANTWASNSLVDSVMLMIDRLVAERNADANRLYAAGYSNGGGVADLSWIQRSDLPGIESKLRDSPRCGRFLSTRNLGEPFHQT